MNGYPPNIRNYPPIICSRCARIRAELTACKEVEDCDFEPYRDSIMRRFHGGPPPKFFFTLTGGVNAGKTFYLLVLIDLILKDDATRLYLKKFGISDIFLVDPITRENYKTFLKQCEAGMLLLTDSKKLSFFNIFINLFDGSTFELVLFNTSGEKVEDIFLSEDEYTTAHELQGAAVIHFVDPREDSKLNSMLKNPKDPKYGACKDYNISEYIHSVLQVVNRGVAIVNNPVAICISKFDLLIHKIPYSLPENPYVELLDEISNDLYFIDIHSKSTSLHQFLAEGSSTIKPSKLQDRYGSLKYFALAPFGNDKYPAYWHHRIPKGILAPFLWILKELKILQE